MVGYKLMDWLGWDRSLDGVRYGVDRFPASLPEASGLVKLTRYGAPLGSPDSPKRINFGKSFKRPLTLPRPIFGNKYCKLIFGDLVTAAAACFGAYWHRFTVNYSLMIKENVQYICLIDR